MAKKPLRRPSLPTGRRLELFLFLQDLVLRNGDPSVAAISELVPLSHQAIYMALTGPKVPSRRITMVLSEALGGQEAQAEALLLWTAAVVEERDERTELFQASTMQRPDGAAKRDLAQALTAMFNEAGRPPMRSLAARSDASRSTIYNLLAGRTVSDWATVRSVVSALGHNPEEIRPLWVAARSERARQRQP